MWQIHPRQILIEGFVMDQAVFAHEDQGLMQSCELAAVADPWVEWNKWSLHGLVLLAGQLHSENGLWDMNRSLGL
jgi:hypothetical protein